MNFFLLLQKYGCLPVGCFLIQTTFTNLSQVIVKNNGRTLTLNVVKFQ